ncbi:MAG: N-acetyltransferase [Chitinophagaceae bacterium]|nr:MAG: N-acetyltransferase [Chitinophagaceae bacterium]
MWMGSKKTPVLPYLAPMEIRNNPSARRFETEVDGEAAFIEYRMQGDIIALLHTWVPPALEGRGIAGALAKWSLEWVKEHKVPLLVYCPYVKKWMEKHPEYDGLLQKPQ